MCSSRRIATLLAIAATAIGLTAGGASAAPAKVAWTKCHSDLGPFQCGTVQVPLDYDQPNGATISLALVRLPASDPAHRIGSLFLNPGGPGGSGVDFVLFAGPSSLQRFRACALRSRRFRPARDRPQHRAALLRDVEAMGAGLHPVCIPDHAGGRAAVDERRPLSGLELRTTRRQHR